MSENPSLETICEHGNKTPIEQLSEGLVVLLRSRYLLAIATIVVFYEIVSSITDFQFTFLVSEAFTSRDQMSGFQGKVFFSAQVIALFVQLVLTTWIHKKCGIIYGLFFLPFTLLLGSTAFILFPTLMIITLTIGGEASFAYSINQASKEILYVPLNNVEKYRGKAFIDMFLVRFAKTIGAGILLIYSFWLVNIGFTHRILMTSNIIAISIWIFAIFYVSRFFSNKTGCGDK